MPANNHKKFVILFFTVTFSLLALLIFIQLKSYPVKTVNPLSPTPTSTVLSANNTLPGSKCVSKNDLPDPNCTPGVIDPAVTQENIFQTICKAGYTKTVRPPVSYTQALKIRQIDEYGYIDTNPTHYEEDHLISLELGGSPKDIKNLWPEPGSSPNAKDAVENLCHKKVCNLSLSLFQAQKEISTDWHTACQ